MNTLLILSVGQVLASQPPHIALIVSDDLGWDDVGFRSHQIRTPTIDQMVKYRAFEENCSLLLLYIYVPSSPCRLHLAVFTPPSQFANNSPHAFLPVFTCCAVCVPPVPFASTPTRARAFSLSVCVLCALSGGGGVLMMDKLGRFESAVADLTSTVQRLEMEKTNQAEEVEG